jgi:hypothetical protein
MLPIPVDLTVLIGRLRAEERDRRAQLADLEAQLRQFADVEQPAYARWLRLELGPTLTALDARRDELAARRATARRVMALVELGGWHPREALYVVLHPQPDAPQRSDRMDADEVAARRRAKVERKRAARKAARRVQRPTPAPDTGRVSSRGASSVVVFRAIARRLHPDSPAAIRSLEPERVKSLWLEAHAAHAANDLDRLLSIAAWLDQGDGEPIRPTSLSERYDRLRALARAARTLEERIADRVVDPAWAFSERSPRERRRLRAAAARALDDELARVEAALGEVADFLDEIGTPRKPRPK